MAGSNPFASLFGRSPFKPMQEHMRVVRKCAAQVTKLFEALCKGDQEKVEAVKERIFELENEADAIKNELRAHLPKSLFMPVDRRDLLEVLDLQDSIADTAQDIAGLLVERKMEVAEGNGPAAAQSWCGVVSMPATRQAASSSAWMNWWKPVSGALSPRL